MNDEFHALYALTDEELRDRRFELYDRAEVVDRSSEVSELLKDELADLVKVEKLHGIRRSLRDSCMDAWPELDADVFASAFLELSIACHELRFGADGMPKLDVAELLFGALEVAERRAGMTTDQETRN